jgi:hypothetical protein
VSILGRFKPRQLIHHAFYCEGAGNAAVPLQSNSKDTGATAGLMNFGTPRAMKACRVWINSAVLAVVTPGNWDLRLRLNRSGSDSATFTFNPTTTDDVFSGNLSSEVLIRPTDQYHLLIDGTERNIILVRVIVEFEII